MPNPRLRLDDLLIERGVFNDLKVARGWIAAGKVVVDGNVVTTVGSRFSMDAELHLRGRPMRFASRGGYKLEYALQRFDLQVTDLVCLDAGASAGGFTDCLLQNAASLVYAVDVGYGLLKGKVATNQRVRVFEKTNISDLTLQTFSPPIDFACIDLSYLSLKTALPIIELLFQQPYDIVALVKPSFEGLGTLSVSEPTHLSNVLSRLFAELAEKGFRPSNVVVSPLLGSRGAIEFLARFQPTLGLSAQDAVKAAINDLDTHPPQSTEVDL
jgi:23S rRNA (cytidine1920-2'-O)/16S rRNA (cytidine1409-2'-O)-methyltransferase